MKSIPIKADSVGIYHVPEELIFEILLRLPVKSVMKFRCVSKSWRYLISSKRFVESQLDFATNNPADNYLRIISAYTFCRDIMNQYDLKGFLNNKSHCPEPAGFYYPLRSIVNEFMFIDTCNGLCCAWITCTEQLFVWNPSTRKHRELHFRDGASITDLTIGFCFHGGDYKVVASYREHYSGKSIAKLFSLRTGSWKRVGNFIPDHLSNFSMSGKFANGKLYWRNYDTDWVIVYFDLGSEAYGTVDHPPGCSKANLVVFQNCLHLISCGGTNTDVWVLKHDESWNRMISIAKESCPGIAAYGYAVPLWITREGEILIHYCKGRNIKGSISTGFIIYDPRSNSFRQPNKEVSGWIWESNVYVTTLVSPFPDDD